MIKVKEILKTISKITYTIMTMAIILMMMFAIVQRTTDSRGSICGIKIFTVVTGSMIPVYNIGDIIIVKDTKIEEIKVDDDIVYKGEKGSYKDKEITHRVRVIEKQEDGNYKIITKGVANSVHDPEINQTQVLGKVIGKIPIFNWTLRVITNVYVWMFIPVVILINKNIKKIKSMDVDNV